MALSYALFVTRGIWTHTSPITSYRGAGRPEAVTLVERLLDRAAEKLGLSPVEIRRRNFIAPATMPYRTPTGHVYDGGDFAQVLERCVALADWNGFEQRRAASAARGRLLGRAVTFYIEVGGRMNERMELRCDSSGTVTIVAGTHSHGQGHATTYAQLVTEWLGVPFDAIRFVQGDTDLIAAGGSKHFISAARSIGSIRLTATDSFGAVGTIGTAWGVGTSGHQASTQLARPWMLGQTLGSTSTRRLRNFDADISIISSELIDKGS